MPKEVTDMWTAAKALKDDVRRLVPLRQRRGGYPVKFLELRAVLFHGGEGARGSCATATPPSRSTPSPPKRTTSWESCSSASNRRRSNRAGCGAGLSAWRPVMGAADIHRFRAAGAAGTRGGERGGGRGGRQERRHRVHGQGASIDAVERTEIGGERNEIAEYKSELVTALQELGATEEVDAWRRQEERAAQKRKGARARGAGEGQASARRRRRNGTRIRTGGGRD